VNVSGAWPVLLGTISRSRVRIPCRVLMAKVSTVMRAQQAISMWVAVSIAAGALAATLASPASASDIDMRLRNGYLSEHHEGPIWSERDCIFTQSNFARYYRIVVPCFQTVDSAWWFFWTER
jgi:hypothetical protein